MKHWLSMMGIAAITVMTVGCGEPEYMIYDTDYNGIYFTEDSLHYSFGVTPIETRTHVQLIPLQIMGTVSDKDRAFSVEVVPSKSNTEAKVGVQYNIPDELVVKADSVMAYLPIEILRDGLAGDDVSGYTVYELRLKLVKNGNFTPTLSEADQNVVLTFDNTISRPEWLDDDGEKVWATYRFGEWNPLKLIKFVEYFHTTLKQNAPATYVNMVEAYGENLEHIPYGWPSDYSYTVNKYIMTPMYDYFMAHPEYGINDIPKPY